MMQALKTAHSHKNRTPRPIPRGTMANELARPVSRRNVIAAYGAALIAGSAVATFANSLFWRPQSAWAETSAEVRAQANAVLARLEELQNTLDILANNYDQAQAEEREAEEKMADAQRRIDEAQAKIDKLKARMSTRVRGMYMGGNVEFLDILFGSSSFSSFVNNVQYLKEMNQNDADAVAQTKLLKAQIEVEKAEYARQEAIAEAKRIEAAEILAEAQKLYAELQEIYRQLDDKANALLRAEIEAERARREAEARARAEQERLERERQQQEQQQQQGNGNGNGNNNGNNSGNNSGDGNGNTNGSGYGNGNGDGNSSGDGNGNTSGNENGNGNGSGNDNGENNGGDDPGNGNGNGSGNTTPEPDPDPEPDPEPETHGVGWNVPYNGAKNEANYRRAMEWVGNAQYVWAACSPGKFDCSGLVAYAVTGRYQRLGTTWNYWNNINGLFPDVSDYPKRGDICVCHTNALQHCGIYVSPGYMVHAAGESMGVIVGWFNQAIYKVVRYVGN